MKLGLFGLHRGSSADPEVLRRRAQRAEAVGFESLWIGDHIALPAGDPDDTGNPGDEPRLEALSTLAFLAGATTGVHLAAGVIVLPQRQPILLAKQLTAIDVLSNGRLIVGIGAGYLEAELTAMGVPLAERGARTDEFLGALRALWDEPTPSFDGRFIAFRDVIERPRPVQRPHPPIVVGGDSPAAYRRAVDSADGWYGWELDVDKTATALAALREMATRMDRRSDLPRLEITITPSGDVDLATARRYADLGVDRLAIQPDDYTGSAMDDLIERAADTLIGRI